MKATRRGGFTLVEMLVVITIISVLAALLIPAISSARIKANEARVMVEINGLASAIGAFKAKYGVEPPSRISIWLTQAGWNSDPTSRGVIRSIWPQFDFSMTGAGGTAYPAYWDTIATASGGNNVININSGECLLFFLGGVMNATNNPAQQAGSVATQTPGGFAKNPLYPFAPASVNTNREGPFFEFTDINRLRDFDGNGMNEWYDSLSGQTSPILYFSSYEGRGYVVSGTANELPSVATMLDVYRTSSTTVSAGAASQLLPAQKGQTFQIISPGYDTQYGYGGVFNPSLPNSGLQQDPVSKTYPDADNLTNFNGGRLNP